MTKVITAKEIENLEWLNGPWETEVWKMANSGVYDFKKKQTITGFVDAHSHICRAFTYKQEFLPLGINLNETADLPLKVKQNLIGNLHEGLAYSKKSLTERMELQINRAIKIGTRELWAITDTTPDIGLTAFNIALKLKEKYKNHISLKVGCYPVFGFKNPLVNPDRYKILDKAAKKADFIMGLPEKDEKETRIGFRGNMSLLFKLAYKYKIEVHAHADQSNSAYSDDTFKIIQVLESLEPEMFNWFTAPGNPRLKVVHVLSPSSYAPEEFDRLVKLLVKYNIGVIVCPRAALSMRELRSEYAPIHNSIARVIEMLKCGVKMSFGTDNINDIFVPSGKGHILSELDILWDAVRNYASHIMVKVAMGIDLSDGDRSLLAQAFYDKRKACLVHKEQITKEKNKKLKIDF